MANIALIGAHRATKLLAPFSDDSWEIWSCSEKNESELPRQDVWFELHGEKAESNIIYMDWLKNVPKVYMQDVKRGHPNSVRYPLEDVVKEFGSYFLTGTVSYMLAAAILEKPDAIGLWGISECPEYSHQKPSLLYFIQEARNRGIEIIVPDGVTLLDAPEIYGYNLKVSIGE